MWRRCLCLLALCIAAPAAAQTVGPTAGDRVRVRIVEQKAQQILIFREMIGDTLVLQKPAAAAMLRMPLASVEKFQVSQGHRSFAGRALRGAGWGFLTGAVIGAVSGAADGDGKPDIPLFSAEFKAAMGAIFLGATGAVVGTVVGAISNPERWQTVPLGGVTVARTAPGGIAVGYRLGL